MITLITCVLCLYFYNHAHTVKNVMTQYFHYDTPKVSFVKFCAS